jgi:hypothetical protein
MAALCSCAESLRLLTKTSNAKSAINAEGQLASRFNEAIARMQQVAILDLLKFQSIHERFDSITQAQERTFSWLLGSKDSSTDGAPDTTSPEQEAILDKARQRWINGSKKVMDSSTFRENLERASQLWSSLFASTTTFTAIHKNGPRGTRYLLAVSSFGNLENQSKKASAVYFVVCYILSWREPRPSLRLPSQSFVTTCSTNASSRLS